MSSSNGSAELKTYAIRRKNAWKSPEEVEAVAARSKQVADDEFPTDVRWIRSYVIAEEDGTLGSVCIYQAVSPEAARAHDRAPGITLVGERAQEAHATARARLRWRRRRLRDLWPLPSRRVPFQGEIFELYRTPTYQGFGLGEKLFDGARTRLAELPSPRPFRVGADRQRRRLRAFYLRLGGKPVAEGAETFGEVSLRKVAFAWA